MIPHEYIEELTRRTDIVELVGSYVQLKRKGRLYGGLCPFHSEKTPSFYVYPDTQSFYCFGCQAAGDAISFVRKINSIDYPDAKLIPLVREITPAVMALADGAGSALGTGGMATKLRAARMVTGSGADMVIANGAHPELLYDIAAGKPAGTRFTGHKED